MIITKYENGGTRVEIHDDGTKVREVFDASIPPIYPETIDMKITNLCYKNCPFCHEESSYKGRHADTDRIVSVLRQLPKGTELAIGGGDATTHPQLLRILDICHKLGLIANLTVALDTLLDESLRTKEVLVRWTKEKLIYGLGVSFEDVGLKSGLLKSLNKDLGSNLVWHLIAGVHDIEDLEYLVQEIGPECKILILGYKCKGRGFEYAKTTDIQARLLTWKRNLVKYLGKCTLSFDNLALDQLNVKRLVTPEAWQQMYMGDDGKYSMYIDCVEEIYAKSSTSVARVPWSEMPVEQFFKTLQ